jgi:hypothetical protein
MLYEETSNKLLSKIQRAINSFFQWIKDNSKQAIFYVVSGTTFVAPRSATVPALIVLGLSANGPVPDMYHFHMGVSEELTTVVRHR